MERAVGMPRRSVLAGRSRWYDGSAHGRPCRSAVAARSLLGPRGGEQQMRRQGLIMPGEEKRGVKVKNVDGVLELPDNLKNESEAKVGSFNLPKKFMDKAADPSLEEAEAEPEYTTEEMFDLLQQSQGYWHELAQYLGVLKRSGVDSNMVDEMTGISPKEQNLWNVSHEVYQTLVESGMEEGTLEFFDYNGHLTLYPLRVLDERERIMCAHYLVDHQLDEHQSDVLVRALRELERRGPKNFEYTPNDAMAYKHYRDAIEESRNEKTRAANIEKGLQAAGSDKAREALEALMTKDDEDEALPKTSLTILELQTEEFDVCLLPVAGTLSSLTVSELRGATKCVREGAFGTIKTQKIGEPWVVVPLFQPVVSAKDPVAVQVENMRALRGYGAKSSGVAMLVIDRAAKTKSLEPDAVYCVTLDGKAVDLKIGAEINAQSLLQLSSELTYEVVGKAVMACRPPSKKKDDGDAVAVVGG